jgi:hypothetical protein
MWETLDPWLCAGRFPGLCLFRRSYSILKNKEAEGHGAGPRLPLPGPSAPEKSYHAFDSGAWLGGTDTLGLGGQSGYGTVTAAHAPRKQGGRQTTLLPASMDSHALLLGGFFSCPGAWSDAIPSGASPTTLSPERVLQAEPQRLHANYRPAGKRSTITNERASSSRRLASSLRPEFSAMLSQRRELVKWPFLVTLSILRTPRQGVYYRWVRFAGPNARPAEDDRKRGPC